MLQQVWKQKEQKKKKRMIVKWKQRKPQSWINKIWYSGGKEILKCMFSLITKEKIMDKKEKKMIYYLPNILWSFSKLK